VAHEKLNEISITVDHQAAEAVENFLLEIGALGTVIDRFDLDGSTETVRGYFLSDQQVEALKRSIREYLGSINPYFPLASQAQIRFHRLPKENWQEEWKRFFRPVRVTRRLVVKPTWETYITRKKEIIIEIDPGMAFGTGLHATTQLSLRAIEREIGRRTGTVRRQRGRRPSLLDVGTGSGILAIGAAKLGATPVLGIDNDEEATKVARQNVRRNQVEGTVKIGSNCIDTIRKTFDIVVANIDMGTLTQLKTELMAHVSLWGALILSGILKTQKDILKGEFVFASGSTRLIHEVDKEEWSCLVYERLQPPFLGKELCPDSL